MKVSIKIFIAFTVIFFVAGFYLAYNLYSRSCDWTCPTSLVYSENFTAIELLDKNYFPVVLETINSAAGRIDMAMFEFRFYETEGNKARQLLDAIIAAKKRGVAVRVLLDGSDWNAETTNKNSETIQYLKENGVDAQLDNPKRTLHAKLILVDNSVIIGSHNLGFYPLERNNEASVLIKSREIASHYENYFYFLWKESQNK